LLLALLPLSTGGAVLVAILLDSDSLVSPTLVLVAGSTTTAAVLTRRLPAGVRRALSRRVRLGLLAGLAATAAYDAIRYLAVAATSWSVRPFQVFALFGQLLVGRDAPTGVQYLAGTAFHLLNGLGFASATSWWCAGPAWPARWCGRWCWRPSRSRCTRPGWG
jgi:hypothetical protein